MSGTTIDRHVITSMPVLVLSPHNRCNCRCVMCDIWRIRQVRELAAADLQPHLASFRLLNVRWVVFSGGEAQLHSDLGSLARIFRAEGMRITLLTAGLLLADSASEISAIVDDVIVSLDGPPEIHDRIRRVPGAFDRLAAGVAALRQVRPDIQISARCTVQKGNLRFLRATVAAARRIGLDSISLLAADTTSVAFNREGGWTQAHRDLVALTAEDVNSLSDEVESLITEEDGGGFVVERPEKLHRIVRHFRVQLGEAEARAPRCNAPWTSAVIDATGEVRPCFFHPAFGNLKQASLIEIVNSPAAIDFRRNLDIETNPTCRNCVCSLYWSSEKESRAPEQVAAQ